MSTYHVLLLYPEHLANYYGETYLSEPIKTEQGDSHAVSIAKRDCTIGNEQPEGWADDFIVLLVMKGGEPC